MRSTRSRVIVAVVTLLLVACGGSVVPVPGSSSSSGDGSSGSSSGASSSGASSSGASSSGASSSGASSSSGSTGSSGVSSSGSTSGSSSGGTCVPGERGPLVCFGCNGRFSEICVNGQFMCPPTPPCPPPFCNGPPPPCACPVNCKCFATCDPRTGNWTCGGACAQDAGAPFACGDKNCVAGDVCIDVLPADGGPQTGPYECLPNPSACAGNYSCACEVDALKNAGTCSPVGCDQTFGNVVVHCASL